MKKDLKSFPFERYSKVELHEDILAPFRYSASYLLPQALAFVANLPLVRNEENKISMEKTLKNWLAAADSGTLGVSRDFLSGLFRILNRAPRGEILGSKMTQSKPAGSRYSAAVPLILSAFKEYRNIKYSEWDYDDEWTKYFVDANLAPLLFLYPYENPFTKEELLAILDETETAKPPQARISITKCSNEEFNKLPRYVKTLLCQVWVWHPSIRHPLAITNLSNLDEPAEPLIKSDVFRNINDSVDDIPWDV